MARIEKSRRRRWLMRGIALIALLLLVLLAIPFLFTTSLVRFALARSTYARFSPTIRSASLSPHGALVMRGLQLHELSPAQQTVLISAGRLEVDFAWSEVLRGNLRDIRAADVVILLRPKSSPTNLSNYSAFSLQDLFAAPPAPATVVATPSASPETPLWFDHLRIAATVQPEGTAAPLLPTSPRFVFEMRMRDSRSAPTREMSLTVGHTESDGRVEAHAILEPIVGGTRLTVQQCSAHALHVSLPEVWMKTTFLKAPATFHQTVDASIARLGLSGVLEMSATKTTLTRATFHLDGGEVSTPAAGKNPLRLDNLHMAGSLSGPIDADAVSSATLSGAELSINSLRYGNNEIHALSTPLTLANGVLEATKLQWTFAQGDFAGSARFSLARRALDSALLHISHLDQQEVAANLAPDKLDAEGTTSGTIELAANAAGTWTGTINLTADGPGKLQIKDQEAAEALANKLETGAAAGVLPANFSTIVVQQLKNYPYIRGHIQVDAPDGVPAVTLNYARDPIRAGDPGYGVKTTIAGQPVLANYTIQLPALTIVLQGKSIAELLALAAGFEKQVAGPPPAK